MEQKFNESQKKAIEFKNGPCLVLSGPGSGKTFVLINRIWTLITKHNINPSNILIITFTRAAANEMKERFEKKLREEEYHLQKSPKFGTFHSIFFEILRNSFGYNIKSLANDVELKKILYVTLKDVLKTDIENNFLSNIFNDINEYKLARECNASFQPRYVDKKTFSKILNAFENKLYFYKKLDFSNMIYMCEKLLRSYKSILKEYQDKFKYILVDEFQDINKSQYDIVKLICKTKNLFVVGDDDQSIYSFRGSCPGIMKTFLKDYRFAKKICLNINYRSTDNIVRYSKNVIDCNKDRLKKDLVANNKSIGNIFIKGFVDSRDENKYIINKIIEYKNAGISLDDIAILYRTNLMAKVLQQDLIKNNISYRIKEDNEIEFYEKDKNDKALSNKSILESVSLMTFHLSKGLEFKIVFIIDANDGIVPHKKSIKSNDIETERRLFYVAMTRAKYNLHIYFTIRRFGKNYKASRFILEAIGGKYGKERKNFNS